MAVDDKLFCSAVVEPLAHVRANSRAKVLAVAALCCPWDFLVPYEVRVHMLKVDTVTDPTDVSQRSFDRTPLRHGAGIIPRQGLAKLLGEFGT